LDRRNRVDGDRNPDVGAAPGAGDTELRAPDRICLRRVSHRLSATDSGRPAGTEVLGTPGWVPPISAFTIFGFTHTATNMNNVGSPLKSNDNVELQQASVFYGGAITEHIGAFAQATYAGLQFGPPAANQFMWDNLDVRYADKASFKDTSVVYGVSVNNSPTVQDPWNTTRPSAFRSWHRIFPTRPVPRR
jgi:hypothetical protein